MPTDKVLLVTGSSGLIGSEVCSYFARHGYDVHGVDNNQRAVFFGPQGDTRWNQQRLERELPPYLHHELDIRDRQGVLDLLAGVRPSVIVHAAAQPSHDRAAAIPFDDFGTHAVGTLNFLEGLRRTCPDSPFVYMSTNKVYDDRPNRIALVEGIRAGTTRVLSIPMGSPRRSPSTRACTAYLAPARSRLT
jgi:CDP-paratose 2-epimerase